MQRRRPNTTEEVLPEEASADCEEVSVDSTLTTQELLEADPRIVGEATAAERAQGLGLVEG